MNERCLISECCCLILSLARGSVCLGGYPESWVERDEKGARLILFWYGINERVVKHTLNLRYNII